MSKYFAFMDECFYLLRNMFVHFFTIKPSKYTSIVSSLLLKSLKPKVLLPCFLSDITCFFPVKRRVKGKKNYCKSRVSTFWVMVLYPLLMVGTNEDNVLTYQISLLGFILSKSKWREYIRENGVRERIGNEKDRKVNFTRCILVLSRLLSGKLCIIMKTSIKFFQFECGNHHAN